MAEQKQVELNQSYYGPTIPPDPPARPIRAHRRPKHGLYSLLCAVFKGLTTTIIILGIITLVLWLIYQPDNLKAYVEPTTALSRFDLNSTTSTLASNLTLLLTIRNPNPRVSIYYKHVQATCSYAGAPLGPTLQGPRFHQPRKNSTTLRFDFAGRDGPVGGPVRGTYGREVAEGWVEVVVTVYLRVRLRMIVVNSVQYSPEVDCTLRLPVPGNATSARVGFQRTQCHVGGFI